MLIALIGFNANAAIYIVGDEPFGGWSYNGGTEMTDNQDGSYSITAPINGSVWFVFADGQGTSWDDFNGNYRFGPTDGDETVDVGNEYTTQRGSNGAYKFTGTGDDYVITFNPTTLKFSIAGYVAPIEVTTYNVVGDFNGWNVNADEMTLVNGVYTLTKDSIELNAGTFNYKFVGNHDYGIFEYPTGMNNLSEPVEKHGYYDVTITFVPATLEYSCTLTLLQEIEDPIIEEHTYTVAGDNATLFGTTWSETDTNNDMTLVNGLYTWAKQNVTLTAGKIEFKVVMDHNWNNGANAWPASNYEANIESNGDYDVTITFNEETKEITFTATPVVITDDFYTVAGSPDKVFGTSWNTTINMMTLVDGVYTWTKDSVELTTTDLIEFKVVKNSNWNTCWPAGDNYNYTANEDGTYNLVITYNPENDAVLLTATKLGGEEPPVEMVYTVVGPEAIFGTNWNEADTNNDMVLDDETGLYTWTADSVALTGSFGFKVVGNHDWANEWPIGYDNNWIAVVEEPGIYTIAITYDPEAVDSLKITCTLTKTGDIEPEPYDGDVYILGEVNDNGGWFPNIGVQMTRDAENNVYTATITTAGENEGYSYFSFTKKIAENNWENGGWDEIAGDRFGATVNDFEITEALLGQELDLINVANAFKIGAGKWNLTLNVDDMTLVITKAAGYERGDVNMDGTVDVNDVTRLIDVNLGKVVEYDAAAADCNIDGGDGSIDINDITALIARVLSGAWAN
ncbi:MAG: hypothetical protein IKI10_05905 [Muribaculaceae bacterium]|nr:hypothetical protein [Muribaculaceae bacterium]